MDKKELQGLLYTICDEIIKEIVEPTCGISGATTDYWLADISVYTNDDDTLNQTIFDKLQEKYDISDDEIQGIDSFTTIIQIALYIYFGVLRPKYQELY